MGGIRGTGLFRAFQALGVLTLSSLNTGVILRGLRLEEQVPEFKTP